MNVIALIKLSKPIGFFRKKKTTYIYSREQEQRSVLKVPIFWIWVMW